MYHPATAEQIRRSDAVLLAALEYAFPGAIEKSGDEQSETAFEGVPA